MNRIGEHKRNISEQSVSKRQSSADLDKQDRKLIPSESSDIF